MRLDVTLISILWIAVATYGGLLFYSLQGLDLLSRVFILLFSAWSCT